MLLPTSELPRPDVSSEHSSPLPPRLLCLSHRLFTNTEPFPQSLPIGSAQVSSAIPSSSPREGSCHAAVLIQGRMTWSLTVASRESSLCLLEISLWSSFLLSRITHLVNSLLLLIISWELKKSPVSQALLNDMLSHKTSVIFHHHTHRGCPCV